MEGAQVLWNDNTSLCCLVQQLNQACLCVRYHHVGDVCDGSVPARIQNESKAPKTTAGC